MIERQWKLGDDMHRDDAIFDEITFRHIIDALHCNERVVNENAVWGVVREMLDSRMQDFEYLIKNNMNEIIAEAMKGRN